MPGRVLALLAAVVVGAVSLPSSAHAATTLTDLQLPFTCGQVWTGDTRSTHSPSTLSIDFNRDADLGKKVLAPAPGVITRVENLGSRSYGLFLVIDHGDGQNTLYAHLSAEYVTLGQRVDAGEAVGAVGTSGGSTGPHLHYEQRSGTTVVRPYFNGTAFEFGSAQASANCPDVPVVGDWDNDGKDNLGTFSRRGYGWFNQLAAGQVTKLRRGIGPDQPLVGDWDGDGTTDTGLRRSTVPEFVLRPTGGTAVKVTLGLPDDKPVTGDWDGDGTTEIGLWRPATQMFWMRRADGTVAKVRLGAITHLPVTGDWNGDGTTDLGTFDPATATWSLRMVAKDATVWTATTRLGAVGDLPATGDWNGDGTTDLGTWTPSTARWTQRMAATATTGSPRIVTRTFGTPR